MLFPIGVARISRLIGKFDITAKRGCWQGPFVVHAGQWRLKFGRKMKDGCFGGSGMKAEFEKDRRNAVAEINEKGGVFGKKRVIFCQKRPKKAIKCY